MRWHLHDLGRLTALCAAVAALCQGGQVRAQPRVEPKPWTYEEASAQLQLYPRDAYLQYVLLQLARREHKTDQVSQVWPRAAGSRFDGGNARDVDLFSMFSGALAVQESLQIERMLVDPDAVPVDAANNRVPLASLHGPTIKSHPWEGMLAGRKPEISLLARCVPDDNYFVEFRSLTKLIDLLEQGDLWGRHVFSQSMTEARTQLTLSRVQRQLAVETNDLARPFFDAVVERVAITGSDLFLREGSDVTLLFSFKQPQVFKAQMELFLRSAQQSHPDAKRSEGKLMGVPYVYVATPDKSVHVFAAYPRDGLHVRSNSRQGLARVLAAMAGKDESGRTVTRLGETTEMAYIRTLLPHGAAEEDGFVYLSDPFIRHLVGPRLKLTARRRLICYNHLRMIGHAALMHRTEEGHTAGSLAELVKSDCCPEGLGRGAWACPDGGAYSLAADGMIGVCSHHGSAASLVPCCELPLVEVTAEEAAEYEQFLARYNQYWRTFFDPIAVRISATDKTYRVETIILPLIDNSIYTSLARMAGGEPRELDSLPVPSRNIFTLGVNLDKRELARNLGVEELLDEPPGGDPQAPDQLATVSAERLSAIGLAMHTYHDVFNGFPTEAGFDERGKRTRLSWRVHILPYLGHQELYDKFRFDEAWDSEHNRGLISQMPADYAASGGRTADGKTPFVVPRGHETLFPDAPRKIRIADVTDGTSNTVMAMEVQPQRAVIWTSPEDLDVDPRRPLEGLLAHRPGGVLLLMGDGSLQFLRATTATNRVAPLLTRSGNEVVNLEEGDRLASPLPQPRRPFFGGGPAELVQLGVGRLLSRGIGSQVIFGVYDTDPMFSFSLPQFLGQGLGSFQGGRPFDDQFMWIGVLVAALNAPVYVAVPVQDEAVVDEFLDRLDGMLAAVARQSTGAQDFIPVEHDYFRVSLENVDSARSWSFQLGPLKWRFFWARIGKGLYVASQPVVLEDFARLAAAGTPGEVLPATEPAHALLRLRPNQWERVLPSFRLGWAESNRQACLHNLGPLSSLMRALPPAARGGSGKGVPEELDRLAQRVHDAHFFCPEGGRYEIGADGWQVTCSVHGSAMHPKQPAAPLEASEQAKATAELADLWIALKFLEDGLHAVVTIEKTAK